MPELPEVETIVRDLNKKIKGDKIVSFESFWPKALKNVSLQKFKEGILKQEILRVWRIGKNIFIDLSNKKTLYLHLKMTGHLLVKPRSKERGKEKNRFFQDKVNQYIRHIFYLQDRRGKEKTLEFSDLRKFGKILLIEKEKIKNLSEIKNLGIDAMSQEFNWQCWQKILEKKNKLMVGRLLMEQNLIAGIGNIYRSEILFASKVNPWRLVGDLKGDEKKRIFLNIKKILTLAIKLRGTSDSDYRDTAGAPGSFQKVLKVYNRENKKCLRRGCKGIIKRKKMNQRSVFWCEKCQK